MYTALNVAVPYGRGAECFPSTQGGARWASLQSCYTALHCELFNVPLCLFKSNVSLANKSFQSYQVNTISTLYKRNAALTKLFQHVKIKSTPSLLND